MKLGFVGGILWLVIVVFIAFVFVDFGGGLSRDPNAPTNYAAKIGGEEVSVQEFQRQYRTLENQYRQIYGERFTTDVDLSEPIGFFFEAMYRTGAYWQFLGWAQVIAGVLLLLRATSLLGALLFFPIILNIFVITLSMDFHGTHVVTGGMLLANLYLLCWDWHRLKPILFAQAVPVSFPAPVEGSAQATLLERVGYVAICASGMLITLWTRNLMPRALVFPSLGVGLVGGVLLLVSLVMHRRGLRSAAQAVPVA